MKSTSRISGSIPTVRFWRCFRGETCKWSISIPTALSKVQTDALAITSEVFENEKDACHLLNGPVSVLFSPNGYEMLVPVSIEKGNCRIQKIDLRALKIVENCELSFVPQEIYFDFKGKHFFVNDGILTIFKTKSE